MKYYRVRINPASGDRWFLPEPYDENDVAIQPAVFCLSRRWTSERQLHVTPGPGKPTRFALGALYYPVLDSELASRLADLDDQVQLIPVSVIGNSGSFSILNTLRLVACADESASKFDRFTAHGSRPDLAGSIHVFYELRLRSEMIPAGVHVFRLEEDMSALIVSESVRLLVTSLHADDGVAFQEVT